MFRIVICEDDSKDLEILKKYVDEWILSKTFAIGNLVVYERPDQLKDQLSEKPGNLYFLDVMMPGLNGIELGRIIHQADSRASIIYVTSSDDFALEAYGLHAIRYIKKPGNREEIFSALDFAYQVYVSQPIHSLSIEAGNQIYCIDTRDVMYIENNVRNVVYTLHGGQKISIDRRSGSFEKAVGEIADEPAFIQPHKSYFVNMVHIYCIKDETIIMDDKKQIPIARKRYNEVKNAYLNYHLRGTQS